jgi:hypothetical protein
LGGQGEQPQMKNDTNAQINYFSARLQGDKRRTITWKALCSFYFQKYIDENSRVLELGAGHCDFINNIIAKEKIAIDSWVNFPQFADKQVTTYVIDASQILEKVREKVNTVFASNFFEHLTKEQVEEVLQKLKAIMNIETSTLILLQPNYRLNPGRYFDDYTHVSIWTEVSMSEFLVANGYRIEKIVPKFLPFTIKS